MKYQNKTFTCPVSQGISQAEWNRIWAPELSDKDLPVPMAKGNFLVAPSALENLRRNLIFPKLSRRGTEERNKRTANKRRSAQD